MRIEGIISFQEESYVILDREQERVYVLRLGEVFEVMLGGQWQAVTLKSGGYRGRYIETGSGQRERLALCMQARIDRVSEGDRDSITSELSVQPSGCLCDSSICLASASQGDLESFSVMSKRGACSSGMDDGTSPQETIQNAFVVRYRGIACLVDCFRQLRPIIIGYRWAYARHTPHATCPTIPFAVWGGVPGGCCCAWLSVSRVPAIHTFLSKGGGADLVGVNVLVIGRTERASRKTIRSKRGWVVCVWCVADQGRDIGKPRPSKYITSSFISSFPLSFDGYPTGKPYPSKCISDCFLSFVASRVVLLSLPFYRLLAPVVRQTGRFNALFVRW